MRDISADRKQLMDQLTSSLEIANELHEAALSYLIERAIDEARTSLDWGLTKMPQTRSF